MKVQPGSLRARRALNALSLPTVADELAAALRNVIEHAEGIANLDEAQGDALCHGRAALRFYEQDKRRAKP